jgi:hypothetical protein
MRRRSAAFFVTSRVPEPLPRLLAVYHHRASILFFEDHLYVSLLALGHLAGDPLVRKPRVSLCTLQLWNMCTRREAVAVLV